jgi:hypothetical protein
MHLESYHKNLTELQNYIFDNVFPQVVQENTVRGTFNIEDSLISLNKLTMTQLEILIDDDLKHLQPLTSHQVPSVQSGLSTSIRDINDPNNHTESHKNKPTEEPEQTLSRTLPVMTVYKYHFYSTDASFQQGKYNFAVNINNIKSIDFCLFQLDCNIYNINEANNKFHIFEQKHKINVSLPVGYYKFDDLLTNITDILNATSVNKYKYHIYNNPIKNKVYFTCKNPADKGCNFNLHFVDRPTKTSDVSLREILGFTNIEYTNNNFYVAETYPIRNTMESLYMKMYVNGKEIRRVLSSSESFSYFMQFSIDLDKMFSKRYCSALSVEPFDIFEDLSAVNVSFEFYTSPQHIYTRKLKFDVLMSFETEEPALTPC